MVGIDELVRIWSAGGFSTTPDRLGRYAKALVTERPVGTYRVLDEEQEDRAILSLYRVDRPHATIADLHQLPPLAVAGYHQMLHDLAREGLGPVPREH
jgi:hypothetical protein